MQSTDLTVLYSPFVQPPQQRSCKGNEKEEKSRPVISFIANLTKQKNPKIFLEAIAKAQGALRSDTQILICGSEREYLHKEIISYSKKIDLNLDLQVKGFQSSITPIMEESDLIICPFHNEGFGRVSVEAMLLSTPVIALNEAGFKEVRNFFPEIELVNDLTASAFANAIISFSQNKKIFLGRRMVPYKLTLNHHLECLFNIYQRLTLQHQT
jgi:glycosyltransferase involved in cell wall biosynthesis